jgi:putative FmdB family regulatory protein
MPIYEYACSKCGNVVEVWWKKAIDKNFIMEPCKPCGDIWSHSRHDKIISTSNFHLHGGGWAKDGYGPQLVDGSPIVSIEEPK